MKRNVWVFGLLAGAVIAAGMIASAVIFIRSNNFSAGNMAMGYAIMIAAFTFVFAGVKNFRDRYNYGMITFGQAFRLGIGITMIASTVYVLVWMVEYYFFFPDFMDRYAEHMIATAKAGGAAQDEIARQTAEMDRYKEMYRNPLFVILLTYAEIVPVGLLITLITALVLKRKAPSQATA